jgi:hypothetical protein
VKIHLNKDTPVDRPVIYFCETKCRHCRACMRGIKHCPVSPPIRSSNDISPHATSLAVYAIIVLLTLLTHFLSVHPHAAIPCSNRSGWKAGAIEIGGTREGSAACGVIRCGTGQRGCQLRDMMCRCGLIMGTAWFRLPFGRCHESEILHFRAPLVLAFIHFFNTFLLDLKVRPWCGDIET